MGALDGGRRGPGNRAVFVEMTEQRNLSVFPVACEEFVGSTGMRAWFVRQMLDTDRRSHRWAQVDRVLC